MSSETLKYENPEVYHYGKKEGKFNTNFFDIPSLFSGDDMATLNERETENIVREHFMSITNKTVFTEKQKLTKEEKEEFLLNFKSHKEKGAVLLAVSSGSFGEGIDLPGILSCVVVAGLPLQKPDLEIKQLIKYYDRKFGPDWQEDNRDFWDKFKKYERI